MDPITIAVVGGIALLAMSQKKPGAYGTGSVRMRLRKGSRYRVTFEVAPVQDVPTLFALPQATLSGYGMSAQPESVTFGSPNWRMTAVAQYVGEDKDIDTLPGMQIEAL